MAIEVEVPNVGIVEFPDDTDNATIEKALSEYKATQQDSQQQTEQQDSQQQSPGFFKALSAGVDVVQQAGGGALAGIGETLGSETIRKAGVDIVNDNEQQIFEKLAGATDWRDIDSVGKFKDYALETFGLNSPQMATILAAGAATSKFAPKTLPVIGPLSKPLAFAGGAAGASLPMFFGMNVSRQLEEGGEDAIQPGKAALAAAGQAVAEGAFAAVLGPSSKMLGIKLSPKFSARMLQKISGAVATGVPGEVVQQGLERAAADLPISIDNEEALEEYYDSALGALLLAGGFGGLSAIPKPSKSPMEEFDELISSVKKEGEGLDAITEEVDGKEVGPKEPAVKETLEEPAPPTFDINEQKFQDELEKIRKEPQEAALIDSFKKKAERKTQKKQETSKKEPVKDVEEDLIDYEALAKYDKSQGIKKPRKKRSAMVEQGLSDQPALPFEEAIVEVEDHKLDLKRLPKPVAQKFWKLGDDQRGFPEGQMRNTQEALGSGVMSNAVEHIGDLTNRMTAHQFISHGYDMTGDKVDRMSYLLNNPYGFEREFEENLKSNAKYRGKDEQDFKKKALIELQKYAEEHKKLKVYNRPQWLARETAIALGERRYDDARKYLAELKKTTDKEKEGYIKDITQYEVDQNGNPVEYFPKARHQRSTVEAPITPKEISAIRSYTFEPAKTPRTNKDIVNAVDKSIAKEDMTLYRGVKAIEYENPISNWEGLKQRSIVATSSDKEDGAIFSLMANDTLAEENAPLPVLELKVPKGHNALDISKYSKMPDEKEVLLLGEIFKTGKVVGERTENIGGFTYKIKTIEFSPKKPTKFQKAYHGTPYDFDAFDLGKVDSGEGYQAFGWGIYSTQKKGIGHDYRKSVTNKVKENVPNTLIKALKKVDNLGFDNPYNAFVEMWRSRLTWKQDWGVNPKVPEDAALIKEFEDYTKTLKELGTGRFYTLEVPNNSVLLDWDASIDKQPTKVKKALDKILKDLDIRADWIETGQNFYKTLANRLGSQKEASLLLNSYGVKGLRYFDGQSRSIKKGSRNFVTFDDKAIKILTKEDTAKETRTLVTPDFVSGDVKGINLSKEARKKFAENISKIEENTRRIAGNAVNLNFADFLQNGEVTTLRGAQQGNTLSVAMGIDNPTYIKQNESALHELYHFLREEAQVFTPREAKILDNQAPKIREYLKKNFNLDSRDIDRLGQGPEGAKEIEATAFGLYARNMNVHQLNTPVRKIFKRIVGVLKGIKKALGFTSFLDIFEDVKQGKKAQAAMQAKLNEATQARYQKLMDEADEFKNSLDMQIATSRPVFEATKAGDIKDISVFSDWMLSINQLARHNEFFAKIMDHFHRKQQDEANLTKDLMRRLEPVIRHKNFPDISEALSHMRDTEQSINVDEQGRVYYTDENGSKRTLNLEASKVLQEYDAVHKHVLEQLDIYIRDALDSLGIDRTISLEDLRKLVNDYSDNLPKAKRRIKRIEPLLNKLDKYEISRDKSLVDIQREVVARMNGKGEKIGKGDANYILRHFKDIGEFSDFTNLDNNKATLEEYGEALNKFVRDLNEVINEETVVKRLNKLEAIYNNLREINDIRENNKAYLPRMRFGTHAVSVEDLSKPKGDEERLVALYTVEETFGGKPNKRRMEEIKADLDKKYRDKKKFAIRGEERPFRLTHEELKKELNKQHVTVEILSSIMGSNIDQEQVKAIVDSLRKEAGAYGLQKNFLPSRNVDGYSRDWERNALAYFGAVPRTLSNIKYSDVIDGMGNEIKSMQSSARTHRYAKDYYDYVTSPNMDQMKLRMFNFFWTMAPNMSTAMLQFATVPTTTASEMVLWDGNILKNNANIAKNAYRVFRVFGKIANKEGKEGHIIGKLDLGAEGVLEEAGFSDTEIKFLRKAFQRGQLNASLAEDFGVAPGQSTGSLGGKAFRAANKVLQMASIPISLSESMSRTMSGLSFFDSLSNKDGSVNEAAINRALESYKNDKRFKYLLSEFKGKPTLEDLRTTIALYAVDNVHAIFGKAARGRNQRGWFGSMIFPFMTHPIQVMENLFEQAVNRGRRGKAAALYQAATFLFIGGLMGLPTSELWKDAYEMWQRFNGKDADLILDIREAMFIHFTETWGMDEDKARSAAEFVTNGATRVWLDMDVSRRLSYPIFFQNHLSNIMGVISGQPLDPNQSLGVVGGVIRGTGTGLKQLQEGENPFVAATEFSPVALSNFIEGAILYQTRGARTTTGKQIALPEELTWQESLKKAAGFTPTRVARRLEQMRFDQLSSTGASLGKTRFYSRIAKVVEKRLKEQAKSDPDLAKIEKLREQEKTLRKQLVGFAIKNGLKVDKKFWNGANRAIRQTIMQRKNPGKPVQRRRNVDYPMSRKLFSIDEEE
jgi:hypothetical protein